MNILLKKEISSYYNNFAGMYNDLCLINKEVFSNNDRIIIKSFGNTDYSIWKHFRSIIEYLDIPVFFIEVHTNDKNVEMFLNSNYKEKIKIDYFDREKINNSLNDQFDYPDSICINPFINLEITNNGKYTPCCEFNGFIGSYNVKEHNSSQVHNSKEIKKIRNQFLSGQWPDGCKQCKLLENHGKVSKRIRDKFYFQEDFFKINWKKSKQSLISLDIKLGNACNLSCRICNAEYSSSWFKEIKNNLSEWGLKTPPEIGLVDWPYDLDGVFWKNFKEIAKDIKYLQFVGGEPLLNKQHFSILEFLVENNYSKNISLHYNTNGTIWPSKKQFDVYKKFKSVGISLSIDNIGSRFEYERYGNNWKNVEENIKKFLDLDKNHYILDVYTTVSIFNVLDLPAIRKYFKDRGLGISFNLLNSPKEFSINNIPIDKRDTVIDQILDNDKNSQEYNFILEILKDKSNYLDLSNKFYNHIMTVDRIRNQKFSDYYPEMSRIIGNT